MKNEKLSRSGDLVFCLACLVLGVLVIVNSVTSALTMVAAGEATFFETPGFTPIVVACLLMILCGVILVDSFRNGGRLGWFWSKDFRNALKGPEAMAVYKTVGALVIYIFVLLPHIPYWASTAIFVFGFMTLLGEFGWKAALIATLVSGGSFFIFGTLFRVLLP